MVNYEKSHLKLAELYYDEREAETRADILRYRFRPEPVAGCRSTDFYTLVSDLSLDSDQLFGKIHKQTRHQIRKAMLDGLLYEPSPRPELPLVEKFFVAFDEFAASKGLAKANRERLLGLHAHDALGLSRMTTGDGRVLVWHAHILTNGCSRLMHSASLFRGADKDEAALIGRANRLLHWCDMQRCQAAGLAVYDMGGWYNGDSDEQKLRINRFKEGFGGVISHQYNADRAITWKGTAALYAKNAIDSLRGVKN